MLCMLTSIAITFCLLSNAMYINKHSNNILFIE